MLKIQSAGMDGIIKLCIGIVIMCTILEFMECIGKRDHHNWSYSDDLMNLIKSCGYGGLAAYIYMVLKKMNFPEIDILTFLTFMLACFEAMHNFINAIIKHTVYILVDIFRRG